MVALVGAPNSGKSTLFNGSSLRRPRSRAEVGRMTGLRADVVDAAVEHLRRMGRLRADPVTTGCPDGGCGTCASGSGGAPGCGTGRSGPVLVALSLPGRGGEAGPRDS